jgi:hypothetical protein
MPLRRVFDGFASPGRRGSIRDSRQGGALRLVSLALAAPVALSVLVAGCSSTSARPPQPARTGQPFDGYRLAQGGQELVVLFWGAPDEPGPCGVDYPAEASETSDRVYVRVRTLPHHQGAAPVACPAIAQRRTATVRLEAPLGVRAVVDGTTGDMLTQPCPTTS